MNQSGPKGKTPPKDRMICFCYSVPESVIVAAIQAGCSTLMDVRRETYASTGCAGCAEEVKKLLKKHAHRAPSGQDPGKVSNG